VINQIFIWKILTLNASFLVLEIVYTKFYLDETDFLPLFIINRSYHKKCLYDSLFIKNETPLTGSSLTLSTSYHRPKVKD
jgi:hypothetical protein